MEIGSPGVTADAAPASSAADLAHLDLTTLRAHRDRLRSEELVLADWCRLLAAILGDEPGSVRTSARWPLPRRSGDPWAAGDGLPQLPPCAGLADRAELLRLWAGMTSRSAEAVPALRRYQHDLARHLTGVQAELAIATHELVQRLVATPAARLDALRERLVSAC